MKLKLKILLVVTCAFIAILANANDNSSFNLLKYSSFEKIGAFALSSENFDKAKPFYSWDCLGDWFNNISVSREAIDGNVSVLFTSPCWMTGYGVRVKAGKKYTVTGYFRTALQTMPKESDLGAYFEIRSGNKVILRRSLSGVNDWTKLTGEFTAPKGEKWIKINIGLKIAKGFCWADKFTIVKQK